MVDPIGAVLGILITGDIGKMAFFIQIQRVIFCHQYKKKKFGY